METELWDIIDVWKESMEESNMEVEEVSSLANEYNTTTNHMHTSIDR